MSHWYMGGVAVVHAVCRTGTRWVASRDTACRGATWCVRPCAP